MRSEIPLTPTLSRREREKPGKQCDYRRDDDGVLGSGAEVLPRGAARAGADGADSLGRLEVLHVLRRDPRGRAACARDLRLWPRLRPAESGGAAPRSAGGEL